MLYKYEGQKINLDKTKSIKVAIKAKRENLWKLSIFQWKKKKQNYKKQSQNSEEKTELRDIKSYF